MLKSRIFELTSKANAIADTHAFEQNMLDPKRCLEHDIDEELTTEEWMFIQKKYEIAFMSIKKSMMLYSLRTKRNNYKGGIL